MNFLIQLIVSTLAVFLASNVLSGVHINGPLYALVVAAVLSFLDTFLKPLMVLLTIPVTLVTMGLFLIVINAFIILIADWLVDGFSVDGFWWAFAFSVMLWLFRTALETLKKRFDKDEERV